MSRDVIIELSLPSSSRKVSTRLDKQHRTTRQFTHLVEFDLVPAISKGTMSIDMTENKEMLFSLKMCPKWTFGRLNFLSLAELHFSHFSTNWLTFLVQSKIRALKGPLFILFSVLFWWL